MSLLLSVIHFICPLIFFTYFTRNPYQSQITLLHLSILAAAAVGLIYWMIRPVKGIARSWKSPALIPLAAFTAAAVISTVYSWFSHPAFFRDSIVQEGVRVHLFWFINVLGAVGIGLWTGRKLRQTKEGFWKQDTALWIAGALFGLGWVFFDKVRSNTPNSMNQSVWAFLSDPYGLFLCGAMVLWLVFRISSKGLKIVVAINLLVGALAALYGVGQYLGWDVIWPRAMNPYGARAISTFGNPNFLSPYLVLLIPIALTGMAQASGWMPRFFWGVLFLIYEAGLLATLTRSSWGGALVAAAVVAVYLFRRRQLIAESAPEFKKALTGCVAAGVLALVMFIAWPTGLKGQAQQSPLKRLAEAGEMFKSEKDAKAPYQPASQRYMIWSACWQFLKDRPLLGKGWGTLELFYPFYQGPLLFQKRMEGLRTHANNGHNELIEIWTQTGIIGMGMAVWFFVVLFIWTWRNLDTLESKEMKLFTMSLLAGAAGVLVDNLLNVSLHFAVPGYLFWWQAGILMAIPGEEGVMGRAGDGEKTLIRFIAIPVLVLVCWLGVRSYNFWLSEFYYFRGFVLHRENNLPAAKDRLEKSHKYFPYEVNRNYELGNVYARLGEMDKALGAYNDALQANAGYDEIYFNRGILRASRNEWDLALKDYLTSLSINPTHYPAYMAITNLFMRDAKQYAPMATRILEQAIHFYPNDKDMLNNLGSFYTHSKGPGHAGEYFLRAVQADPSFAIAQRNLASEINSLARMDQKEKARDLYRRWKEVIAQVPPPSALGL